MPTPEQARKERIEQLLKEFKGKDAATISPLLIARKAISLYPFLTKTKAMDYAETVLRMLHTDKT